MKPNADMVGASDSVDLPIFVQWMDFLKWLAETVEKFPKKARFTVSERLLRIGLDVLEDLIRARYSKSRIGALQSANLGVEKIRVLIRLSYELRFLSMDSYQFAARRLLEVGRMLGGWMKLAETKI